MSDWQTLHEFETKVDSNVDPILVQYKQKRDDDEQARLGYYYFGKGIASIHSDAPSALRHRTTDTDSQGRIRFNERTVLRLVPTELLVGLGVTWVEVAKEDYILIPPLAAFEFRSKDNNGDVIIRGRWTYSNASNMIHLLGDVRHFIRNSEQVFVEQHVYQSMKERWFPIAEKISREVYQQEFVTLMEADRDRVRRAARNIYLSDLTPLDAIVHGEKS